MITGDSRRVGITVSRINPNPVDTNYAHGAFHRAIAQRVPEQRWRTPDDVARLVAWLVSDEGRWMAGQVLDSEGGFRRSSPLDLERVSN